MSLVKKLLFVLVLLCVGSSGASAQVQICTVVNYYNQLFHPGCINASDLNNAFSQPPVIGSVVPNSANFLNLNVQGSLAMVGTLTTAPSTTGMPGLVVTPGVPPNGTPPNGSLWVTASGFFGQVNGLAVGPFGNGSGGGGSLPSISINQIYIGQSGGAPAAETMTGDGAIIATGVLTVLKTNGTPFGALATLNTVPATRGGTGLTVGTLGGIPYFNTSTTMASTAQLAFDAVMVGGGPGAAPQTISGTGTAVQTLHGNASGLPTWAQVNLSTDVSGLLPIAGINASGTMNNTTFLRGDATWAVPSGGGGGGSLTVTGSTGTVTPVTSLTLAGFTITGSTPNATASPFTSVTPKTASYALASGDLGNILTFSGSGITFTIPATTTFVANSQVIACNIGSTAVTISSTPPIIGYTPTTIPATINGIATCIGFTSDGTNAVATVFNDNAFAIQTNTTNQAITGGFNAQSTALGTVTSGTQTLNCTTASSQTLTNNGAFTLAPPTGSAPAGDGYCVVLITNGASAGAVTLTGWTHQGANNGDALTTTNGNQFMFYVTRVNGFAHYQISALQ